MRQQRGVGLRPERVQQVGALQDIQPQMGHHLRRAARDMQIGMEIARFRQDLRPFWRQLCGRDEQLEDIDRDRVGDQHLMRFRADQTGDLAADARRCVDPVGIVPAADQPFTPLAGHHVFLARHGGDGERPERIAVEIDQLFRQMKTRPHRCQRILDVQIAGMGKICGHLRPNARSISSTAAAQAAVSGAISSTCPLSGMKRTCTSSPLARISASYCLA